MTTAPVKAAGFIIFRKIVQDFEYLLLKASYEENLWTPPKGHVDEGESDLETAYRETEEEAGLKRTDIKIINDFERTLKYTARGKPKEVVYWLAELQNNAPIKLSDEHVDYKWANIDKACELGKFKEMTDVFKECQSYLEQNYHKLNCQCSS